MTLSPEDVIKKSFSATHLRRGYDETQVDDFLDEVVLELRRLIAENDSLRSDLEDCRASRGLGSDDTDSYQRQTLVAGPPAEDRTESDARQAELTAEVEDLRAQLASCQEARADLERRLQEQQDAAAVTTDGETDAEHAPEHAAELEDLRAKVAASDEELRSVQEQLAQAQQRAEEADARAAAAGEQAEQQGQQIAAVAPIEGASDSEEPTAIIALAQRLHDQHVAEGESARAQLVGEAEAYRDRITAEAEQHSTELTRTGQETHDRLVNEGQTTHDELVRTGQETHDRLVGEGQATHDELVRTGEETRDRLVGEGESRSRQLVGEAEQQRSSILEDLNAKQGSLNGQIDELRTQEADLRDRLRTFLTDQLSKVDGEQG